MAFANADQVVLAVGFDYAAKVWEQAWPLAMRHVLAAAEQSGARVVFVDNLYMYGPQRTPLVEDMNLTSQGRKPKVRAEVTRLWQDAVAAGRVTMAAVRASDFYGPGVLSSHLGDQAIGALAAGRAATLIIPPDQPHDFAYVPDIARAVVTLLDAPDDAFGQSWHVPNAPTCSVRALVEMAASALEAPAKISTIPPPLLPLLGLVIPFVREMAEMRFQWDRPYQVDAGKFAQRFWSDATPFEVGIVETAASFLPRNTSEVR
jgi:nucleoside-diphosphate-sugar epimerase